MASEDLSTNDIEMYQLEEQKEDKQEIDYKRVDEIVKDCQKLYPEMDQFVLWVLACDYYIKEELKKDFEVKEEYKDIYEKCKAEFKRTKEYAGVNVIPIDETVVEEDALDVSKNIIN
jgi:hypothetical protein